jgi:clan AA aspartic protease
VTVTLRASEKSRRTYQADFLVDSGATDCMAPGTKLQRAGIRRRGRMAYELADGTTVEYDFGLAEIEFMGELTSGRILFGPDTSEPILGVTALESVGITVEPSTQQLRRLPAIPLKSLLNRDKRSGSPVSRTAPCRQDELWSENDVSPLRGAGIFVRSRRSAVQSEVKKPLRLRRRRAPSSQDCYCRARHIILLRKARRTKGLRRNRPGNAKADVVAAGRVHGRPGPVRAPEALGGRA